MTQVRLFPSIRFALVLSLAGLWFIFASVWSPQLVVAGYIQLGILFVLTILDMIRIYGFKRAEIARRHEQVFSVGITNKVSLSVKNPLPFSVHIRFREDYPEEFVVDPPTPSGVFAAQSASALSYSAVPQKRGDYRFGAIYFRATTALGLVVFQGMRSADSAVKVYPDISQTRKHALLSRVRRTREMGFRLDKNLGRGRDFDRLREYLPDDELRMVDWNATARRAKLITREYNIERNQEIMILLDIGRTMASKTVDADGNPGPSKADLAINAALLLSYVASQWEDRVGLCCFADQIISYLPPGKGKLQSACILDELYMHEPRLSESNYYNALMYLNQKQRKRCLVILFTDLIDEDSSARLISAMDIISKHHLTVCVAISDYELKSIIEQKPDTSEIMYNQTVALSIIADRTKSLALLAAKGVITLDATPAELNTATVNKYIQAKHAL